MAENVNGEEKPVSLFWEAAVFIGLGLVLQVLYIVFFDELQLPKNQTWERLCMWVGIPLGIFGGFLLTKHKGHPGWLGALLGWLSIIGLIVLVCLPNKRKQQQVQDEKTLKHFG